MVLTRGTTYTVASIVTATNLGALITNATVAGLERQHFNRTQLAPITKSPTAPSSPVTGEAWMDSTSQDHVLVWTGSAWVSASGTAMYVRLIEGASQGHVLRIVNFTASPNPTCAKAIATSPENIFGVALKAGFTDEVVLCQMMHEVSCRVQGTPAIGGGNRLTVSSTDGVLEAYAPFDRSAAAIALTDTIGSGIQQIRVWLNQ